MKSLLFTFLLLALTGCFNDEDSSSHSTTAVVDTGGSDGGAGQEGEGNDDPDNTDTTPVDKLVGYSLFPEESNFAYNKEGVIPPQCYTKHEGKYNPCMTCHQNYEYGSRPNYMFDGGLQSAYDFSDYGFTNRWINLFEDRTERITAIHDDSVITYVDQDNYSPLIKELEENSSWNGPIPKIENLHLGAEAFDEYGFAKDGSDWVAFNYKPLPSTFWPTNGSTDDVMIRLPEPFRTNSSCRGDDASRDTYIANLALLEMTIQELDSVSIPTINEQNVCVDLDGDGKLTESINTVRAREYYVGDASDIKVVHMLYPKGTEFIHSVRYIGVKENGDIYLPPRMKELRYMLKSNFHADTWLISAYGNEQQEKIDGILPKYNYDVTGTPNEFGWTVLGFIEDEAGRLRVQSREESFFCMGCHTTIGSTIDHTFAFPRKISGAEGWGYINLIGMIDAPSKKGKDNEILEYFRLVGGGDEFRQNEEVLDKWFNADGTVKEEKVRAADVYDLITPSRERALALNKAYWTIVKDQDFHHGRDANLKPAVNVYRKVDENSPTLPGKKTQTYDIRLKWAD